MKPTTDLKQALFAAYRDHHDDLAYSGYLYIIELEQRAAAAEALLAQIAAVLDKYEVAMGLVAPDGTPEPWPLVRRVEIAAMASCDTEDQELREAAEQRADAAEARVVVLEAVARNVLAGPRALAEAVEAVVTAYNAERIDDSALFDALGKLERAWRAGRAALSPATAGREGER